MSFPALKELVGSGHARMVHIEAVPRSISTALGRALGQGPCSTYVNEPFSRFNQDIGVAARHVLGAHETLGGVNGTTSTIVTKTISRRMPDGVLSNWAGLSSGIVWCVRNPLVQISSLVTRIANDNFAERGGNALSSEQIYEHLPEVVKKLSKDGFAQTGWESLGRHHELLSSTSRMPDVVIDGDELTMTPEETLEAACGRIGLTYSSAMVNGWDKDGRFHNASGYVDDRDASGRSLNWWVRDAETSSGLHSKHREPLDINLVPAALSEHILTVAMPIYQNLMSVKGGE